MFSVAKVIADWGQLPESRRTLTACWDAGDRPISSEVVWVQSPRTPRVRSGDGAPSSLIPRVLAVLPVRRHRMQSTSAIVLRCKTSKTHIVLVCVCPQNCPLPKFAPAYFVQFLYKKHSLRAGCISVCAKYAVSISLVLL